jgi:hypothetical protein
MRYISGIVDTGDEKPLFRVYLEDKPEKTLLEDSTFENISDININQFFDSRKKDENQKYMKGALS